MEWRYALPSPTDEPSLGKYSDNARLLPTVAAAAAVVAVAAGATADVTGEVHRVTGGSDGGGAGCWVFSDNYCFQDVLPSVARLLWQLGGAACLIILFSPQAICICMANNSYTLFSFSTSLPDKLHDNYNNTNNSLYIIFRAGLPFSSSFMHLQTIADAFLLL